MDGNCRETMRSDEAMNLVRKTRMGGLCFPARARQPGGELVKALSIDNKSWTGSECTAFAMVAGSVTNAHVDSQLVLGEDLLLPAAGVMMSVNRKEDGAAKRAVVVCAHDMERAVAVLKLNTSYPSAAQHKGPDSDVDGLVGQLMENGIKFVVCDFPPDCSYALPPRCVHMFVTLRLVESCVWHPAL